MKTFCITYTSDSIKNVEYYVQASSSSSAITLFKEEALKGNLDFPCTDFKSINIIERD